LYLGRALFFLAPRCAKGVEARTGVSEISKVLYLFEDYALDTGRREQRRGAGLVSLEPQVFDFLEYVIRNRQRVVSKDDLIASIWDGRVVSESALSNRINAARTAIGDNGEDQRLIRIVGLESRAARARHAVRVDSPGPRAAGLAEACSKRGKRRAQTVAGDEQRLVGLLGRCRSSAEVDPFRWSQFLLNPYDARESASLTRVKYLPAQQCDCRRGGAADKARG
jgi:hypothetical protein